MKKPASLLGVAFLTAILLGVFFVDAMGEEKPQALHFQLYPDATMNWREVIKREGSAAAYKIFKEENLHAAKPHLGSHQFGRALYLEEGMEAISICDGMFGYGCYHELVTQAVHDKGMPVIHELDDACKRFVERFLACQHGIGHAVLSILGYTEKALIKGLDICHELKNVDPIGGCVFGVFMEYTLRTMLSLEQGDEDSARLVHDDPFYPCTLPDMHAYRNACYHWQPLFWVKSLSRSGQAREAVIAVLDERCSSLSETDRGHCVQGIGNVIPLWMAQWDPNTTIRLCGMLERADDIDTCLHIASSVFAGNVTYENRAGMVCGAVSDESVKSRCLEDVL